jgi:hypothetical protein
MFHDRHDFVAWVFSRPPRADSFPRFVTQGTFLNPRFLHAMRALASAIVTASLFLLVAGTVSPGFHDDEDGFQVPAPLPPSIFP